MKLLDKFSLFACYDHANLDYFCKIEPPGEELIITDHGRPVLKVIPFLEDREDCCRGLRNTVLKDDAPLESVGAEDWDRIKVAIIRRIVGELLCP